MRRSLPYLLLAAAAGLALPAVSHAEYVLRTRFLTVQFGRQAPPTAPPAPVSPQPLPPLPTDAGAPPPVPETLPPSPPPLPPEVEQPLTPPRPVQAPLPPASVAPVGPPVVAPALPPGPAPALPPAVTPAMFVKGFQPLPGNYEVVLIHPYTGCPVTVRFCLPPCPLKKVLVNKHRIEFCYRGHRDVVIRFLKGGGVWVRE